MKKIIVFCVLNFFFINPSQANDITDFQIEGISLYDSALQHFQKLKLKIPERLLIEIKATQLQLLPLQNLKLISQFKLLTKQMIKNLL